MYRIAIIDDEIIWQNTLKDTLRHALDALEIEDYLLDVFSNPESFRRAVDPTKPYDLLFLDINFPSYGPYGVHSNAAAPAEPAATAEEEADASGLSLAEELRRTYPHTRIALVSAHQEYVYEGYDVEAVYFFLKPAKLEKLISVIKKDYTRYQQPKKIHLRLSDGDNIFVLIKDIQAVEQYYAKTHVYFNNRRVQVTNSFKSLEDELPNPPFIRCHQSYLVNLEHVVSLERYTITLKDHSEYPVSKKNYSQIRETYDRFMLAQVLP